MGRRERDRSRKISHLVVNGETEGYYYEDTSDPGIFVIYRYDSALRDFVFHGMKSTEKEAKAALRLEVASGYQELP